MIQRTDGMDNVDSGDMVDNIDNEAPDPSPSMICCPSYPSDARPLP